MADHKKEITLTDLQQKIALVTARSDYKNRKARDDASSV